MYDIQKLSILSIVTMYEIQKYIKGITNFCVPFKILYFI